MNNWSARQLICIICSIILAYSPLPVFAETGSCPESANVFWSNFRKNIIKRDVMAIIALAKFPFLLKGVLDESPIRSIDIEGFKNIFPSLLETDPGFSANPTTMAEFIADTPVIPDSACNQQKSEFRIGEWIFEKKMEDWYFVKAYVDD